MTTQSWFQKETLSRTRPPRKRHALAGKPFSKSLATPSEAVKFANRLLPSELIAMLTHHYARVRARSLPKVKTSLSVVNKNGNQAVIISFG
ncbi:MAG: hypothetical protein ACKVON_03535 [Beijerinckiaceae bacterium]